MGGHYPQVSYQVQVNDNGLVTTSTLATATQQHERWNAALYTLATQLFPDCCIDYLRQLVIRYDHSIVEQVTTALLVTTGDNTTAARIPERLDSGRLLRQDLFRSGLYKSQAMEQLGLDYPQVTNRKCNAQRSDLLLFCKKIWKSSICAVLAENNWDYINSYDQLSEMGSGGFWRSLRNFFTHWSLSKTGSSSASSSSSSSSSITATETTFIKELDQLRKRKLDHQSALDTTLAHELNTEEYDTCQQSIACDCCFTDYAFEQLVFCSHGNHGFCHDCITRFMMEGLFGQGALRGVDRIPCIASDNRDGLCPGCLPTTLLHDKVLSDDIWKAYETSLFEVNMTSQQWALVQCASCSYCELDESIRPIQHVVAKSMTLISLARWVMVLLLLVVGFQGMLYLTLFLLLVSSTLIIKWDLQSDLQIAYYRLVNKRRGYAFQCRNPSCAKLTCLQCMHVIRGLHTCWENEKDGLRLYIEKVRTIKDQACKIPGSHLLFWLGNGGCCQTNGKNLLILRVQAFCVNVIHVVPSL
jgi:hypothetical protein